MKIFQPRFLVNGSTNPMNFKTPKNIKEKLAVTAASKVSFSDSFTSLEEKEAWLEKREQAKRQSHSTF